MLFQVLCNDSTPKDQWHFFRGQGDSDARLGEFATSFLHTFTIGYQVHGVVSQQMNQHRHTLDFREFAPEAGTVANSEAVMRSSVKERTTLKSESDSRYKCRVAVWFQEPPRIKGLGVLPIFWVIIYVNSSDSGQPVECVSTHERRAAQPSQWCLFLPQSSSVRAVPPSASHQLSWYMALVHRAC